MYGQSQKQHKTTNWSNCLVQIWGNGRCGVAPAPDAVDFAVPSLLWGPDDGTFFRCPSDRLGRRCGSVLEVWRMHLLGLLIALVHATPGISRNSKNPEQTLINALNVRFSRGVGTTPPHVPCTSMYTSWEVQKVGQVIFKRNPSQSNLKQTWKAGSGITSVLADSGWSNCEIKPWSHVISIDFLGLVIVSARVRDFSCWRLLPSNACFYNTHLCDFANGLEINWTYVAKSRDQIGSNWIKSSRLPRFFMVFS
jgi:hypothetical protein